VLSKECQQGQSHSNDRKRRTNYKSTQEPQRILRPKREHKRRRQRELQHLHKAQQGTNSLLNPEKTKKKTITPQHTHTGIEKPQRTKKSPKSGKKKQNNGEWIPTKPKKMNNRK